MKAAVLVGFGGVADGRLAIPIAQRFSLSEIRDAQVAAQRGAGGKVVVRL